MRWGARRISPAGVTAAVALFVSLGGTASALIVTGKQIKNETVTGADVRKGSLRSSDIADGSLLARDFKPGQLPTGPPGAKGETGAKGDPGPKGDPGEPGAPAAASTPAPREIQRAEFELTGGGVIPFTRLVEIDSEVAISGSDPGTPAPPRVVLVRPHDDNLTLWTWHETARQGDLAAARKSGTLRLFDASGTAVLAYHLESAWPSQIVVDGDEPDVTETVTLVAEFIQRVSP